MPPLMSSQMLSRDVNEKSRKRRRYASLEPSIVIRLALMALVIPVSLVLHPPAVGRYGLPSKLTGKRVVSPPVRDVRPCLKKGLRRPSATPVAAASADKRLSVPREELQPRRIEEIVAKHVGRRVSLDDSQARLSALSKIEQFDEQARRHCSDRSYGFGVRSYFARLMQA